MKDLSSIYKFTGAIVPANFNALDDVALVNAANDESLGNNRARAIVELVERALTKPELIADACAAIASDKRIGFHKGAPLGWFGADRIFLSQQKNAMIALLREMDSWEYTEQEDLVQHWAGKQGLAALTHDLRIKYGWSPRYKVAE